MGRWSLQNSPRSMQTYVPHPLYPISRALAHLSSTSQVARANFKHAGVSSKIDIIVGSARETLPKLQTEPFDLVFIDADKESNAIYYKEARRLTKPGSVIVSLDLFLRFRRRSL